MRQVATNLRERLRQMAANVLPLLVAFCRVAAFRSSAQRTRWGMVSIKMTGFPIPESRSKSRSIERTAMPHLCANSEALNERSETGSETEQVGSGMNGRRRSEARFQERLLSA